MQSQASYIENSNWVTISFIVPSVNIVTCLFVLIRLCSLSRRNGTIVADNIKYPLYLCISYFLCAITQIINLLINHSSSSRPERAILNGIFGKFSPTFLTMNLLLIGCLEFSTLFKIKKKVEIESGKYDIHMWNGILLLSWVASIFGVNRYEQLELRYALRPDTGLECYFNVALILWILISTIFYFFELRKILRGIILREFLNRKNEICDHMDPNTLRSILFCIVPFLLQWSLILFYNFAKLIGNNDSLPLNTLLVIAVNIGGIGHAISYFTYERKYIHHKSSNVYPSYGAIPTDQITTVQITTV